MPYAYPIPTAAPGQQKVPRIFRDFPDLFDPAFEDEASLFAAPLRKLADDPSMLGYFVNIPAIIGEWHFGAIDVGLPAPGIGHVASEDARGQAYRYFVEQSAARPWCVGAHWFTLYDQSALGRADGENYNIGFIDVCHRPYEALALAARETHERLYNVATDAVRPFDQPRAIVERLNM